MSQLPKQRPVTITRSVEDVVLGATDKRSLRSLSVSSPSSQGSKSTDKPKTACQWHPAESRETLRFERRAAERHTLGGRVTALSRPRTPFTDATRGRICPLQLLNISDSGVAAIAQEPVEVGSAITIFFPPHGPERGFDAIGRVVRCRPFEHGHELGVHFDTKPAA